ncbi:MAG: sulfatase [bacterium]
MPLARRLAFAWSVSGALACLVLVYANYLLRDHNLSGLFGESSSIWGSVLLMVIWVAAWLLVFWPVRRLAGWLARRHGYTVVFPVLIIIVSTSLWPDWREEGRVQRTVGMAESLRAEPAESAPNLILVTIDTWRHDYLSRHNPLAPPTPNLDGLADEGLRFSTAWSTSPWTLPSLASLMTGLPPRVTGVARDIPLPDGVPRLAEIAWLHGYRTVAFATNPFLTDHYGFGRGFEFFEHSLELETVLPAKRSVLAREAARWMVDRIESDSVEMVIPKTITWLWQHGRRDTPFFLWVHLMNPHLPYEWRELIGAGRRLQSKYGTEPDLDIVPDSAWFAGRQYKGVQRIRDGSFVPDATDREAIRTLYAREVQYTDYWLGLLFSELQRLDLWDESLLVVAADHGEELFEHNGFEHGHSVFPEVTHVPLLVRLPGAEAAGEIVAEPVSLGNLLPTLCHLLDWSPPTGLADPRIWPRFLADADSSANEPLRDGNTFQIIENLLYEPQWRGVMAWPWYRTENLADSSVRWYDLQHDPGALQPVEPPSAAEWITARADSVLAVWDEQGSALRGTQGPQRGAVPESIQRKLQSLGY